VEIDEKMEVIDHIVELYDELLLTEDFRILEGTKCHLLVDLSLWKKAHPLERYLKDCVS
tara:strand:+ start:278 stop:454 length:177 start_codon:yes stop_codon:yes gene_type:complete